MFSPRDDMHKRGLCRFAVSVCPSVCLSRSCILLKQMNVCLQNLFTVGYSHAISFSIPKVMAIFRRGPLTGVSNADGVGRNRDSRPESRFIACCQRCDRQVHTVPPDSGKLVTLIAGSKRRSLLMTGDDLRSATPCQISRLWGNVSHLFGEKKHFWTTQ